MVNIVRSASFWVLALHSEITNVLRKLACVIAYNYHTIVRIDTVRWVIRTRVRCTDYEYNISRLCVYDTVGFLAALYRG